MCLCSWWRYFFPAMTSHLRQHQGTGNPHRRSPNMYTFSTSSLRLLKCGMIRKDQLIWKSEETSQNRLTIKQRLFWKTMWRFAKWKKAFKLTTTSIDSPQCFLLSVREIVEHWNCPLLSSNVSSSGTHVSSEVKVFSENWDEYWSGSPFVFCRKVYSFECTSILGIFLSLSLVFLPDRKVDRIFKVL